MRGTGGTALLGLLNQENKRGVDGGVFTGTVKLEIADQRSGSEKRT